jgi:hypothetical protein
LSNPRPFIKGASSIERQKNRKRNGLKGSLFLIGLSHEDCVDMGYLHGRGAKHTLSPKEGGCVCEARASRLYKIEMGKRIEERHLLLQAP